MLRMFSTVNGQIEQIDKPESGSWLALSDPTDVELTTVSQETGVDLADLRAPLDDEERYGWSTGVSCMQTVMMSVLVTMIDNGIVSYQLRPARSPTVGMSTMIIV